MLSCRTKHISPNLIFDCTETCIYSHRDWRPIANGTSCCTNCRLWCWCTSKPRYTTFSWMKSKEGRVSVQGYSTLQTLGDRNVVVYSTTGGLKAYSSGGFKGSNHPTIFYTSKFIPKVNGLHQILSLLISLAFYLKRNTCCATTCQMVILAQV